MITHRNAAMNTIGTLLHLPIGVGEPYLWTLPMFHANGWTYTWTVTAAAGVHICLRKVDPAEVFRLIRDEHVGSLCAAPTVLISLANASPQVRGEVPPGVRVVTAGAAPAAATIERLEGEFGWEVTQVYGLTETAPFITVCAPLPEHEELSSADRAVIKARTGVELITSGELLVVDEKGVEVPADGQSLGEIVVRGNVVMDGYYHDPEATERAMGDGWFHTGDAAVLHPDGYVEIRDRIKDVIISGGENISSLEVEGVLLRHPAVVEAAIVGLPHEKWGEAPYAYVVLRDGEQASEDGDHRLRPRPARPLQGPARGDVRDRAAQDRDRQDPEVRPARRRGQPGPPVRGQEDSSSALRRWEGGNPNCTWLSTDVPRRQSCGQPLPVQILTPMGTVLNRNRAATAPAAGWLSSGPPS